MTLKDRFTRKPSQAKESRTMSTEQLEQDEQNEIPIAADIDSGAETLASDAQAELDQQRGELADQRVEAERTLERLAGMSGARAKELRAHVQYGSRKAWGLRSFLASTGSRRQ